jgi:hypothetical protein
MADAPSTIEDVNIVRNQKIMLEDFYRPSREIQEEIFNVYEKFIRFRSLREQSYKQFNGMMFSDWLQEAREKYWGYLPIGRDNDTPQFFFPETRNQINSILGNIANLKQKPKFEGVKGFDLVKSIILKSLFEAYKRSKNQKIKNFWQFLYTVINGTCIVFVGFKSREIERKRITLFNAATGETEWSTKKEEDSDVEEVICNLEDIYIPKLWEPDIQEQDEVIWRTLIKWSDFKNIFEGYSLSKFVFPGMQFADQSIFSQFLAYDVRGSDFVEVIKYFNVPKDRYMIIANGVLLNPMKEKGSTDEMISPLPWNHKQLPFAKTVFEPLDANFFYGMPLPQKVKSPQEALNRLWELALDREERSVSAPIITTDPNANEGLEFKAGRIYGVGVPVDEYKEMSVEPLSSSYWNMLGSLQNLMQRSGSGSQMMTGSKQPKSATEKSAEQQAQIIAAGVYTLFYQDLQEQVTWLAMENMIQFYTAHQVQERVGEKAFRKVLSLSDMQLAQGGMGNMEVRITDKPSTSKELKQESWFRSMVHKERVEIIECTPKMMNELRFDIKIDFETENTPETEQALFTNWANWLMQTFYPLGLVDPKKILFRATEIKGELASDYIPDSMIQQYEQDRFGTGDQNGNNQPPPQQQGQQTSPGQQQQPNPGQQAMSQVQGRTQGAYGAAKAQQNRIGKNPLTQKYGVQPVIPNAAT